MDASVEEQELKFLERLAERLPADEALLKTLGDLYTRAGFYEKGLAMDRRLVVLCPDQATVWYNLGCSLALVGRRAEALAALRRAVELGYRDGEWMSRDEDLRSLRDDAEFRALLRQITAEGRGATHHERDA